MQLDVKAFMTGSPLSIEPSTSALAALDLMVEHAIRHLPVVDRGGRVRGVVSFDDLRAALPMGLSLRRPLDVEDRRAAADYAVGEIMTYPVVSLRYDRPLEDAVSTMLEHRIGCLPVLDEKGALDGILTETDLLQALATMLWTEHEQEHAPAPVAGDLVAAPEPPVARDLVAALEEEAIHLRAQLEEYEDGEQAFTELRREVPLDVAEVGAHAEGALLTGQLAALAARRLRAIEEALERADRGVLGVCETCGGRIPERRLRVLPSAQLCIACAREAERFA